VFSIPFVWVFGFSIVGIQFFIDMFLGLFYAHSIFPRVFWFFFIEFPTPFCAHLGSLWVFLVHFLCSFGFPLGVLSSFFMFIWVPLECS
jgi:hypothetical protein